MRWRARKSRASRCRPAPPSSRAERLSRRCPIRERPRLNLTRSTASNDNRLGAAPHRCNGTDRRGSFDTSPGAEHCQYLWRREIDSSTTTFLRSDYSDSLGFCYDHAIYHYDSNGDNMADSPLPACADLQDGFGTGSDPSQPLTYFGAADLGCVDSSHAGLQATGKPRVPRVLPLDDLRLLVGADVR